MFKIKEFFSYFTSLILFLLFIFLINTQINYTYIFTSLVLFSFMFFSFVKDEEISLLYKEKDNTAYKIIKYSFFTVIFFIVANILPVYLYILTYSNKFILFILSIIIPIVTIIVYLVYSLFFRRKNNNESELELDSIEDEVDRQITDYKHYKNIRISFSIINLISSISFVIIADFINYKFKDGSNVFLNSDKLSSINYVSSYLIEFLNKLSELSLFSNVSIIDKLGNLFISIGLIYFFLNALFFIVPIYSNSLFNKEKISYTANNKYIQIINNYKFIFAGYFLFILSYLLVLTIFTDNKEEKVIKSPEYVLNNAENLNYDLNYVQISCGFNDNNLEASMALDIENKLTNINNDIFNNIKTYMIKMNKSSKDNNIKNELLKTIEGQVSYLDDYIQKCLGYNIYYKDNLYNLLEALFGDNIDITKNLKNVISSNDTFKEINTDIENKIKDNMPFAISVSLWIKNKFNKDGLDKNKDGNKKDINLLREEIISDYNLKINDDINFILKEKFNINQDDLNIFQIVKKKKEYDISFYAEIDNKSDYETYIKGIKDDENNQKEYINSVNKFFKNLRTLKKANEIYEIYLTSNNNKDIFIEKNILDNKNSIESIDKLSESFNLYFLENKTSKNNNLLKNGNTFGIYLRELSNKLFIELLYFNKYNNNKNKSELKLLNLEIIQNTIEEFSIDVNHKITKNFETWNNIRNNALKEYIAFKNSKKDIQNIDDINHKINLDNNISYNDIKNFLDEKYGSSNTKIIMTYDDIEKIQSKIRNIYNKYAKRNKITIEFNERSIDEYKKLINNDIKDIKDIYKKYNIDTNIIDKYLNNFFDELVISKNNVIDDMKDNHNFNVFINYFLTMQLEKALNIINEKYTESSGKYYPISEKDYILSMFEESTDNKDNKDNKNNIEKEKDSNIDTDNSSTNINMNENIENDNVTNNEADNETDNKSFITIDNNFSSLENGLLDNNSLDNNSLDNNSALNELADNISNK